MHVNRSLGWWTVPVVLALGCQKDDGSAPVAPARSTPASTVSAQKGEPPATPTASTVLLPFKDAVVFEPPDGEKRPPDRTFAGKNVAALFEEIAGQEGVPGLWDKIALTTPDGKYRRCTAHLKTDLGTIEIELFPDAAPNHVRNFIALAQAGYYDGLPFHRTLSQKVEGQTLAYLEGGCPLGTGEFGVGSLGYWLKPEIAPHLTHEEGTLGAVRGESVESAACKFYITLTRSPGMDGSYTVFGRITKGLDIAHTINKRPVVEEGDLSDRPREPVIVREVTVHLGTVEAAIVAQR